MRQIVQAICIGQALPFKDGVKSAIAKLPVSGRVNVGTLGIEGDFQADRKVHGGPHMAVHQYPLDHHEFWRREIGISRLLDDFGGFGSNLAVSDMLEHQVRIGDKFRLGTALLEISQPRQPCWKIEHRFQRKGMVAKIIQTANCGWYYRVIEEGFAQTGDTLILEHGAATSWTVNRVFNALWGNPESTAQVQLAELAALPSLSPKLQAKALSRLR